MAKLALTVQDVGKYFRTRGGWRAKIIHHKSSGTNADKGGPFEALIVHKPSEAGESMPVWQNVDGGVLGKWKLDPLKDYPSYGMHVADLLEEIVEPTEDKKNA